MGYERYVGRRESDACPRADRIHRCRQIAPTNSPCKNNYSREATTGADVSIGDASAPLCFKAGLKPFLAGGGEQGRTMRRIRSITFVRAGEMVSRQGK